MKNKGFTLIELLAVIVILAIIALIATPIILNIINDSKKSSNERSTELYISAVEQAIVSENMKVSEGFNPEECTIENSVVTCDGKTLEVGINGNKPQSGTIKLSNGKVTTGTELIFKDFTATIDSNNKIVLGNVSNAPCTRSGEVVTCSTEQFYVIAEDSSTITMFAKYNLDTGIQLEIRKVGCELVYTSYENCMEKSGDEGECSSIWFPYYVGDCEDDADFDSYKNSPTYKQDQLSTGYDLSASSPYLGVLGNLNQSTVLAAYQSALEGLGVTVNSIRIPTYNYSEEEVEVSCETVCQACDYDCASCEECDGSTFEYMAIESGDIANMSSHDWYNTTSYWINDDMMLYLGVLKDSGLEAECVMNAQCNGYGYGIRPVVVIPKSNF